MHEQVPGERDLRLHPNLWGRGPPPSGASTHPALCGGHSSFLTSNRTSPISDFTGFSRLVSRQWWRWRKGTACSSQATSSTCTSDSGLSPSPTPSCGGSTIWTQKAVWDKQEHRRLPYLNSHYLNTYCNNLQKMLACISYPNVNNTRNRWVCRKIIQVVSGLERGHSMRCGLRWLVLALFGRMV